MHLSLPAPLESPFLDEALYPAEALEQLLKECESRGIACRLACLPGGCRLVLPEGSAAPVLFELMNRALQLAALVQGAAHR